jgi:hypothetical protein
VVSGDADRFEAVGLPRGLTIDSKGLISGQIDPHAPAGTYVVTVTAYDDNASTQMSFTWYLDPLLPPTVTNPGPQQNDEGEKVSWQLDFSNVDRFEVKGLPKGLSMDNKGVISGTIDPRAAGTYTVEITAWHFDVSTRITFTWKVNHTTPPELVNPGPQTSTAGQSVSLQLTSKYASRFEIAGLPPGLIIDPTTGKITGVIDPDAAPGDYTVQVTAWDGDLFTTISFVWTVT